MKYSATYLYINDVFIFRSAKVAVISDREYLVDYFVLVFRVYDMNLLLVASELD